MLCISEHTNGSSDEVPVRGESQEKNEQFMFISHVSGYFYAIATAWIAAPGTC